MGEQCGRLGGHGGSGDEPAGIRPVRRALHSCSWSFSGSLSSPGAGEVKQAPLGPPLALSPAPFSPPPGAGVSCGGAQAAPRVSPSVPG